MCIFCKIVNKEIDAYVIYEDESTLAFLDISQVTKGHTLVIPKAHSDHFLACPPNQLGHLFEVSQKLGDTLKTKLDAKGLNILTNVGVAAGQSVEHFHIHLIPRYNQDDGLHLHFEANKEADLEATLALIQS